MEGYQEGGERVEGREREGLEKLGTVEVKRRHILTWERKYQIRGAWYTEEETEQVWERQKEGEGKIKEGTKASRGQRETSWEERKTKSR